MHGFGGILLAVVVGVIANLVTPHLKRIFRRGFVGFRKHRVEVLNANITNAYFFNEHPTWLILFFLSEFTKFLLYSIVVASISYFLIVFNVKFVAFAMIANALSDGFFSLLIVLQDYARAKQPRLYEAQAKKTIAKLTGEKHVETENQTQDSHTSLLK